VLTGCVNVRMSVGLWAAIDNKMIQEKDLQMKFTRSLVLPGVVVDATDVHMLLKKVCKFFLSK